MYQFHQELHSSSLHSREAILTRETSWVMTSPGDGGFIKLPNERTLFTSPPRTSLQISTPNPFPGAEPLSVKSDAGIVYITNQRLVYLPTNPTSELQSFSCPILNTQDTYVRAPFFGANYWIGTCKAVQGGGIPPTHATVEIRLTFREGGAFDFHTTFEQIKERLYQAYSVARESGQGGATANLANVHLEQLPAYEAAREVEDDEDEPVILSPIPVRPTERDSRLPGSGGSREAHITEVHAPAITAPSDPPPGYEEVQAQAVSSGLDHEFGHDSRNQ